jgi:PKD repeat protein
MEKASLLNHVERVVVNAVFICRKFNKYSMDNYYYRVKNLIRFFIFFTYYKKMKKIICLFIFTMIINSVLAIPLLEKKTNNPLVDFTYNPDTVHAGAIIRFMVISNLNPSLLTCQWNWGDGTTQEGFGESFSHVFPNAGIYTVKLVGTNNSGVSDSIAQTITVLPASLIRADFTYFPDTIYSGTSVLFTDNSYIENGYINFTGFSIDSGITFFGGPVFTFGQPGVYNLFYEVSTSLAEVGNCYKLITVLPGGQATLKVCPGATKQLYAYAVSTPYQWQLSTDSGSSFTSITDSPPYSGSNTQTLSITNTPSSFYGYIYRCVSPTDTSTAYKIEFSNTFTGSANSIWENVSNWSCGSLPDPNTDVIINGGNVFINSNAVCRTLRLLNGANVTVATGYTLTVTH